MEGTIWWLPILYKQGIKDTIPVVCVHLYAVFCVLKCSVQNCYLFIHTQYSNINLLACGTGITPMLQVIREVVENEDEETFIHLVYGCQTQDDILLKKELDHYATFWNFTVLYALSRTDADSLAETSGVIKYGDKVHFGRIDADLVVKEMHRFEKKRSTMTLVCGTDQFNKDMLRYLCTAGYMEDMCFKF